jgi:hypothetical protein
VAENSQAVKPILNAWQSALVTAVVMVVLFFLAERGLHALWENGWLGNNDIYLLVVFGGLFLLIAYSSISGFIHSSEPDTPYGDARFATQQELLAAGLIGAKFGEGIRLGFSINMDAPGKAENSPVSYYIKSYLLKESCQYPGLSLQAPNLPPGRRFHARGLLSPPPPPCFSSWLFSAREAGGAPLNSV